MSTEVHASVVNDYTGSGDLFFPHKNFDNSSKDLMHGIPVPLFPYGWRAGRLSRAKASF